MTRSRRSVLAGTGGLAAAALSGCLSEPPGMGGDSDSGYAAFFALSDWANRVAGDRLTFESPVEVGELGHGWEPPPGLSGEVAESAAFVYLDTPEFAWAQDLAATLAGEHGDVTLIDGMDGLEPRLLPVGETTAGTEREPDDATDVDPEAIDAPRLDVYDPRTGERLAYWHGDHRHGELPDVQVGSSLTGRAVVEAADGTVLPLGPDERFGVDAVVADGADADPIAIETDGDRLTVHGETAGSTRVEFRLLHGKTPIWDTSSNPATVTVVDEADPTDTPEFYDPHVWVDPVLAAEMVETIADGLAEHDPDGEATYRENADAYVERLADVDDQLEEIVEEASHDLVILAGHDSFGYVDARYDVEIHTPVGVSADEVESSDDVAELVELVETHDLETVLYDPFETPNPDEDVPDMVDVLLADTDVRNAEPVTSIEGTTAEWAEADYGYVEQWEEINLPSLRRALGVS